MANVKERVPGDVAAEWKVNLPDGIHHVEIEHGTASGKRVIRVDGKEVRPGQEIYVNTFNRSLRPF